MKAYRPTFMLRGRGLGQGTSVPIPPQAQTLLNAGYKTYVDNLGNVCVGTGWNASANWYNPGPNTCVGTITSFQPCIQNGMPIACSLIGKTPTVQSFNPLVTSQNPSGWFPAGWTQPTPAYAYAGRTPPPGPAGVNWPAPPAPPPPPIVVQPTPSSTAPSTGSNAASPTSTTSTANGTGTVTVDGLTIPTWMLFAGGGVLLFLLMQRK